MKSLKKEEKVKLSEEALQEQPIDMGVAPVQADSTEVAQAQDAIPANTPVEGVGTNEEDSVNSTEEEKDQALFTPPAKGYVPAGWIKIEDLATAVAQSTGDVEAASISPDVQSQEEGVEEGDYIPNNPASSTVEEGSTEEPIQAESTEEPLVQESKKVSNRINEAEGKRYHFYEIYFGSPKVEENDFEKSFPGPVEALQYAVAHSCGFDTFAEFEPHKDEYDIPDNMDLNKMDDLVKVLYGEDCLSGTSDSPSVICIVDVAEDCAIFADTESMYEYDRDLYSEYVEDLGEDGNFGYEDVDDYRAPRDFMKFESKRRIKNSLKESDEDEEEDPYTDEDEGEDPYKENIERIPVSFKSSSRFTKASSSLRKPSLKVKESYEGFLPAGSEHFADAEDEDSDAEDEDSMEDEDLVRAYEESVARRRREIAEFRKGAAKRRRERVSERRVGDYFREESPTQFREALRGSSRLMSNNEEPSTSTSSTSTSWSNNRLEEKRMEQQWSFKELLAKGWLG